MLRAYCHREFEAENLALIRRLDWATPDFVPPVTETNTGTEIAELDALWAPTESPNELARLYERLDSLLRA